MKDVRVGLNLCSKTVSWADVLFAYLCTATSSSLDHNWHPLLLAGQSFLMPLHLCTCDGGAHCCIAFLALVMVEHIVWVSLSAALPKLYICWCSFAEIKRFSYDFLVSHQVADLLLAVNDYVSATSHRPHIGHQFFRLLWGLSYPHQRE